MNPLTALKALFTVPLFAIFAIILPVQLTGAPLKSATVQETKNDVNIEKEGDSLRPAVKTDVVLGKDLLKTGKKSRALLEFNDRSIARLGSNTTFSFDSTGREMKIERGSALIHVPPGLSGARISTPAATAAILGDVIAMRVNDEGATQFVALSRDSLGPITITHNGSGDKRTLEPGELITTHLNDTKLPDPISINVDAFIQSSTLTGNQNDGFKAPLPETAAKEIQQAQEIQHRQISQGRFETREKGFRGHRHPPEAMRRNFEGVRDTTVQSNLGSRFAGLYFGNEFSQPSPIQLGTIEFHVFQDGNFNGVARDLSTGNLSFLNGHVNQMGQLDGIRSGYAGPGQVDAQIHPDGRFNGTIHSDPVNFTVINGQKQ
jgi:hypothetical protein